MGSVNPSTQRFCSFLKGTAQVWLLQLYLPNLTGSEGIDGPKWFKALTFYILDICKAWSILNNLTGRSRQYPRHCLISAVAIASQLVRNGRYEAFDRKSSRHVSQKISDLWRATTPDLLNP